ncbi:hypothetical protein ACPOL_2495 [Acidisarcina polymorpha]|uniref:Uncharacterized protein n=1 Tax=Acidisarcina polymorpha TaxID=2211140 RepID=A0A2Z5FZ94_9BACT|nr:hypothetical protein ACPOL_2495 [Acidisarcina polymorpha]
MRAERIRILDEQSELEPFNEQSAILVERWLGSSVQALRMYTEQ